MSFFNINKSTNDSADAAPVVDSTSTPDSAPDAVPPASDATPDSAPTAASAAPPANNKTANNKNNKYKIKKVDPVPVEDDETQPLLDRTLDPLDPKVSPMNLPRIRLLRTIAIVLLAINCVLFVFLLLSDFVAIPGFFNRGKSFLEMDLVLIAGLANGITIWCFEVPATYERVAGYIISALLLLDFIIIFLVPDSRDKIGLFGTFILIWTGGNFLFDSLANYFVEKARDSQEIRYTGRIETRRSVKELMVITVKTIFKVLIILLIWNISLTLWIGAFDTHEKPWGDMVPVNDGQFLVHVSCKGPVYNSSDSEKRRQPIVLIEGGQLTSSEVFQEWIEELYHLDKIERYCIWDRPGYGWSDSVPSPVSLGIITEYLIEALEEKGIEGPFSLVGFDIGGLYSRMFASRVPGKVHSLLFVDSWHEDLLKISPFSGSNRKNESVHVFKNILELMNVRTGFKLWLRGVVSPLGIRQNLHWLFHPRRYSSRSRIFGSDMYYSSQYIRARLQEQVTSLILSYSEVKGADIHNLPVSVISSDFMIKNSLNWGKWQREISLLSSRTIEWVIAKNSNHFIWESAKGREQLQQLLLRLVSEKSNY